MKTSYTKIFIDGYYLEVIVKKPSKNYVMVSCNLFFSLGAVGKNEEEALKTLRGLYFKLRDICLNKMLNKYNIKRYE